MAEFDGPALLEVLVRHQVAFVLVGGFAAVIHGSPVPTRDVDITPEATRENLDRVSAALRDLDARVRTDDSPERQSFAHDAASLASAQTWNLSTRFGDLDISMVPSGTAGYEDLRRDSVEIILAGTPIRIASLADVVRSKDAANRDKDRRVLPVLRELLARQQRRTDRPDRDGAT